MSGFKATYKASGNTANTGLQSLFRYEAPANQKVWLWISSSFKDAAGAIFIPVELRKGTTGGTKSAAVTWSKENVLDTETLQGAGYTYSAQPNNDGRALRVAAPKSDRQYSFQPVLLSGGETLDIWVNSTAVVGYDIEVRQDQ